MELCLKVIVSSNIRRKKPWKRVEWIGKQKESVCLLDRNRTSILYLPSGYTKRTINALKAYKKDIVSQSTSLSGEYFVALLASGKIIRWQKDTNNVLIIPPCPGIALFTGKDSRGVRLFASDDGNRLVVILNNQKVNVWEEVASTGGEWSIVPLPQTLINSMASRDASVDVVFFKNQVQGECCVCCFVSSDAANVNVFCLLLHWLDDVTTLDADAPRFSSALSLFSHPLHKLRPSCRPIRHRGGCLMRLSHDGQVLALALNQPQPRSAQALFIDLSNAVAIASNYGRHTNNGTNVLPQFSRTYWISMMAWLRDDLFLCCITRRGSVLMFTRAGELVTISARGAGIELEPSYFLPVHPLVEHDKYRKGMNPITLPRRESPVSMESSLNSERRHRQMFSITTHPRLPIFLCSDGFLVTAMQMTSQTMPHDVAILSLIEANHRMTLLVEKFKLEVTCSPSPIPVQPLPVLDGASFKESKYTRFFDYIRDKFKKKKPQKEEDDMNGEASFKMRHDTVDFLAYEFEKAEKEMASDTEPDSAEESQRQPVGAIMGADEGKITFGDFTFLVDSQTLENTSQRALQGESLVGAIEWCVGKLLHSFGILTSEDRVGCMKRNEDKLIHDQLHLYFLDTLQNVCDVILAAQEASLYFPWKVNDAEKRDYRGCFKTIMASLSRDIITVGGMATSIVAVVAKSFEIAMLSTLKLRNSAPEGCVIVKDLHGNAACTIRLLLQAEDVIRQTNWLDDVISELSDCFDSSRDIISFRLSITWMKFSSYISHIFTHNLSQWDHPMLVKMAHATQCAMLDRATPINLHDQHLPVTLVSMATNLKDYRVDSALRLATLVLNDHLNIASRWNDNNWKAVELFCSIMTSYFTNQPISFTFPISDRVIILDRLQFTSALSAFQLPWSPNHCVIMLLRCGRMREAIQLAVGVGAWRVAIAIAAVASKVRASGCLEQNHVFKLIQTQLQALLPPLLLRGSNKYDDEEDLESLFDYHPELLSSSFVDLFTMGVMSGYQVVGWASARMLQQLKELCRQLPLLVADNIHLPSPPLYLPQPSPVESGNRTEVVLRHKISAFIRTLLVVFASGKLTPSLLLWYTRKLKQERSDLPSSESASQPQDIDEDSLIAKQDPSVAAIFRELCALLWMLHVREQLTIAVQKYQKQREELSLTEEAIDDSLGWCNHIKPFAKFLNCVEQLQSLVLCLCFERKVDKQLASTLAFHFCDLENISSKVRPRLEKMEQRLGRTPGPSKPFKALNGEKLKQNEKMRPMSVYYQRQCSLMLQKNIPGLYLFCNASDTEQPCLTALTFPFDFESDHKFHLFISRLFDVVSGRADSVARFQVHDVLLVSNRHKVAIKQLAKANAYLQRQRFSAKPDFNKIPSGHIPLQKSLVKVNSCSDVTRSKQVPSGELFPHVPKLYLSQPQLIHQVESEVNAGKWIQYDFNFEVSDAPISMQKRLRRLFPYMSWLEFWTQNDLPVRSCPPKPSFCLKVTGKDLLQSLFVAEIRFGKNVAFTDKRVNSSSSTADAASGMEGSDIPQVSRGSQEIFSKVVADPLMSTDQSFTIHKNDAGDNHPGDDAGHDHTGDDDAGHDHTGDDDDAGHDHVGFDMPQGSVDEEGATESKQTGEQQPMMEEVPKETINEEENVPKNQNQEQADEGDATLLLDALQDEEDEKCSECADGGSSRRPSRPEPKRPVVDGVADVVRSEIHNVLLAQQVSLLSQILLGQTMNVPQGGVVDVLSLLRNQSHQPPTPADQPSTTEQLTATQESHSIEKPQRPSLSTRPQNFQVVQAQTGKFGIPLFHIPGITKSQESQNTNLIQTPDSKQSWRASRVAKSDLSDLKTSPKLLANSAPRKHAPTSRSHKENILPLKSNPLTAPSNFHREPSVTSQNVKTAFPIPVHHTQPSVPMHFREQVRQPVSPPKKQVPIFPPQCVVCHQQKSANAGLIDPREIIAYQQKKRQFISIKKPPPLSVKPPVMLTAHPSPTLLQPLVSKQSSAVSKLTSSESTSSRNLQAAHCQASTGEKENEDPKPKPAAPSFDGYLKQEDLNNEVKQMLVGSSDRTQASAHLVAAITKQTPAKPRMVDADVQVQVEEEEHDSLSDEDFRNKLSTKPLNPPPDVFDRIRKETIEATAEDNRTGFLHVNDVAMESVVRGFPSKPMSVAEVHYRSTCLPHDHVANHNRPIISEHIQEAIQVHDVGAVTRHRWTSAMKQMDAQLDSIDAMARNMDADFKVAAGLVEAISELEATATTNDNASSTQQNVKSSHVTNVPVSSPPSRSHILSSPPPPAPSYSAPPASSLFVAGVIDHFSVLPTKSHEDVESRSTEAYRNRLNEAYRLATSLQASDEVFVAPPCVEISDDYAASGGATNTSGESIGDNEVTHTAEEMFNILNERVDGPRQDKITRRKNRTGLSGGSRDKDSVRRWMRSRRKERVAKYRTEVAKLRDAEVHPFQPKQVVTDVQLRAMQRERQVGKRKMLASHMDARIGDSVKLIGELRQPAGGTHSVGQRNHRRSPLRERYGRHPRPVTKSRSAPYSKRKTSSPSDDSSVNASEQFGDVSISSVLSAWTLNDDVKRALYGNMTSSRRGKVTFRLDSSSVDRRSRDTESLLEDVDWNDVDAMIASVEQSSDV